MAWFVLVSILTILLNFCIICDHSSLDSSSFSELLDRYFGNEDVDVCFFHSIILHNYIGARVAQWVWQLDYLTTLTSLSPIRYGFAPGFVNCKTGCTRLAAVSDKAYQLQLRSIMLWKKQTSTSSFPKYLSSNSEIWGTFHQVYVIINYQVLMENIFFFWKMHRNWSNCQKIMQMGKTISLSTLSEKIYNRYDLQKTWQTCRVHGQNTDTYQTIEEQLSSQKLSTFYTRCFLWH
jgi:hypothetical protein